MRLSLTKKKGDQLICKYGIPPPPPIGRLLARLQRTLKMSQSDCHHIRFTVMSLRSVLQYDMYDCAEST